MSVGQCTLLCVRRLIALLECAAVSYSSENTRNKLRIIDIAEAVKHLVFLAEVDIKARIE